MEHLNSSQAVLGNPYFPQLSRLGLPGVEHCWAWLLLGLILASPLLLYFTRRTLTTCQEKPTSGAKSAEKRMEEIPGPKRQFKNILAGMMDEIL